MLKLKVRINLLLYTVRRLPMCMTDILSCSRR